MSKKVKKEMTLAERVGDTSGYDDNIPAFTKNRKLTVIFGLIGIVVLITLSIIFLSTPIKVYFVNEYSTNQTLKYTVNSKTKTLNDAPNDPTAVHYDFGGWYLNESRSNPENGLFNNSDNTNLLDYKFTTKKKVTYVYAKWNAHQYTITYNVKGNANINDFRVSELERNNPNPLTYTAKRELKTYEIEDYMKELIKKDPDKYNNNSQEAQKAQEAYEMSEKLESFNLQDLTLSGWTFLGWFDNDGKQVTKIDRVNPKDITLTARWQQN